MSDTNYMHTVLELCKLTEEDVCRAAAINSFLSNYLAAFTHMQTVSIYLQFDLIFMSTRN